MHSHGEAGVVCRAPVDVLEAVQTVETPNPVTRPASPTQHHVTLSHNTFNFRRLMSCVTTEPWGFLFFSPKGE
jgi:hypothetical protein